ncbi:MAG: 50S ribosomal protein L9 [Rickettsiales bacterium]|nr:MAG: 50S ribosomal protein L9 [Rickettsiales bacterium]
MQVILVKSVRKLGKIGDTVNVADGFGRNYLIPQELAIRATRDNVAKFSTQKNELEEKNKQSKILAEKVADSLKGKHLTFVTQSAADGRLFGSVSSKAIAAELTKITDINLNYANILLENPIKFNGVYEVQVSLHSEVTTNILIVIAKTDSEAQDALKEFKEGGKKEEIQKEDELNAIEHQSLNEIKNNASVN